MKIFIVEDDQMQAEMIKDHLAQNHRYDISVFTTGEQMLTQLANKPDVVLLDYNLNSVNKTAMDGADVLKKIKAHDENTEVVMYSGQDSIEVAVNTMKFGAFDYIIKNASAFHRLDGILLKILKMKKMDSENSRLKRNNLILVILVIIASLISIGTYIFVNMNKWGWTTK